MAAMRDLMVSPENYLEGERLSETKHEYVNGEVCAMAGASREHNLISNNIGGELRSRLRGRRCEVHPSDMRLLVSETGMYTYPDVMVVCERPRFADEKVDTLLNPKVIFEALSSTTEVRDRTWKWAHYRRLESLAEYVLVAQDECRVEQYTRQADGTWVLREYTNPEDSLRLTSIGCELPLSEIYYLVETDDAP